MTAEEYQGIMRIRQLMKKKDSLERKLRRTCSILKVSQKKIQERVRRLQNPCDYLLVSLDAKCRAAVQKALADLSLDSCWVIKHA